MSESVIQPSQLDYQVREILNPNYKYVKIPLNNLQSSSTTFTPTNNQMLEFKLPTQVYNLARSYIGWSETYPLVAARYSWSFEDTFTLGQSITFGQSGGVNLVDLQYAQNFQKISRRIRTPIEDYLQHSDMNGLFKCNVANSANLIPGTNGTGATYTAYDNYIEPRYTVASGAGALMYRWRQYQLGAFKGTLLGMDREFYSPTEMYLRINGGPGDKISFTSDSASDPSSTAASIAAGVAISNCYLYLAVEQNSDIVKMVMNSYASGTLNFQMPYTTAFRNVGAAANATTNIQIQISQQYGRKLKRILHTVWNPHEKIKYSL